jgi:hypothetical protein
MSTPVNRSENLDAALEYTPPRNRERTIPVAERLASPVIATPARARDLSAPVRARQVGKLRPEFSGDRAMLDLQRQLALNPDIIPEPSPENASVLWPILLRLCTVTVVAAAIAWGLVSFPSAKKTMQMMRPERPAPNASLPERANAPNSVKLARVEPPVAATLPAESLATVSATRTVAAAASLEPNQPAIAAAPSQAPPAETAPQQQDHGPMLRLGDTEVSTLVSRGRDFLNNGDLASARLLLRRAAEAGSSEGALALAATYDPRILHRLGAIGATPDIAKAREWYQRAINLGSTRATQRLAKLDAEH